MFRFIHKGIWAWHHWKQPLPNCKKLLWSLCACVCDIGEMDVPAVFWQTLHFPYMVSNPAWYRCHQTFVLTADLLSCCCTLAPLPRGIISQVQIWSCKSTCLVRSGAGAMRLCNHMCTASQTRQNSKCLCLSTMFGHVTQISSEVMYHMPSYTQKLDRQRAGDLLITVKRKKHSPLQTKKKQVNTSKLCVKINMGLYCVAFKKWLPWNQHSGYSTKHVCWLRWAFNTEVSVCLQWLHPSKSSQSQYNDCET